MNLHFKFIQKGVTKVDKINLATFILYSVNNQS